MANHLNMILRSKALTNSAAEFVGTGAGQVIITQALDGHENSRLKPPEFVTELDKFVPQDGLQQEAKYFESSLAEMTRFEETLKAFCKTLKKRKLGSKLGIEMKEPRDYTMQDVMLIADLIYSKSESSDATGCMRVIRKCFRAAGKHEGALSNLLSFAPTDIYGSVISGGFTLILTAVKDHEALRKDIQIGLAEIPTKLDAVHRQTSIHVKTGRLKSCVDSVIVAIFAVLERIIDKLSMNFTENLVSKVKGHGSDIRQALESLDASIQAFQEEIDICAQIRMGRIEENGLKLGAEINAISYGQIELVKSLEKIAANQQKLIEGQNQTMEERMTAILYNKFYQFIASNPNFNNVDGTVSGNAGSMQLLLSGQRAMIEPPEDVEIVSADKNKELVETWLLKVVGPNFNPLSDITECLDTLENLSLDDKDKVQWIMNSNETYEWLSQSRACFLAMDAETPPSDLENPISFATAMLAACLSSTTDSPVLSFFCGIATNTSASEAESGPLAMISSLNGQLLKFIAGRRQNIDLTPLRSEKCFNRSQQSLKYALALFRNLLDLLNESQDTVFVLLDSLSRISGNEEDGDKIIERIVGMTDDRPAATIKVLVTDMLPGCPLREKADFLLRLPDQVDGGKLGINLAFVKERSASVVEKYQAQRTNAIATSDDESSDSDW